MAMFDLEKLKKIDLKNIDINKILPLLLEQKEFFAQIVVVIVSVLTMIGILSGYRVQNQQYHREFQQLKDKAQIVQDYEGGMKKMKAFLAALPKELDEGQIASQIADYAAQNNVAILSFAPSQKKTENLTDTITVRMSIRANGYKDFVLFVKAIEKAPFALRVDSCLVSSQGSVSRPANKSNDQDNAIEAQMEIASVNIRK